MIREHVMYQAVCDKCGVVEGEQPYAEYVAWESPDSAEMMAFEAQWDKRGDQLICDECIDKEEISTEEVDDE